MLCLTRAGRAPALLAVFVLAEFSFFAFAATSTAQEQTWITEEEFLAALDETHPAVVESRQAIAQAKARVAAASTFENPTLEVEREDSSGSASQTEWIGSWQLPDRGRGRTIRAEQESVRAEEERHTRRLLTLRLRMQEIYADWAFAQASQDQIATRVDRIEALAEREDRRAEGGEASQLEAHRFRLAASALRTRLDLTAATVERAKALAQSWYPALAPEARPMLPPIPEAIQPPSNKGHGALRALESDLAAAKLEREAAGYVVRSPEIALGWQRQEGGSASEDGSIIGLSWSIPLFDRKGPERAKGDARIAEVQARLEITRREIASARAGALAAFERLRAAYQRNARLLEMNERMLAGAESAFELGELGVTDLLDTHRSVIESELASLDLYQAVLAAQRELQRTEGTTSATAPPDPNSPPDSEDQLQEDSP